MARGDKSGWIESSSISRRTLVGAIAAGAAVAGSRGAMAQAQKGTPQTVVTTPPCDFGPNGAPSTYFWDPDVVIVDPAFRQYVQPNTPIMRLWKGSL
jgi:gluconolactonase